MQKIKISLMIVIFMVIASISLPGIVQGAQVTRLNKEKGLVFIDGSKNDGFVMGAKVCFYTSSGDEITCGRIQQTSASYSTVKVNNRKAKRIKYGTEATLVTDEKDENNSSVTKKRRSCSDNSNCGDNEICINGQCCKTR